MNQIKCVQLLFSILYWNYLAPDIVLRIKLHGITISILGLISLMIKNKVFEESIYLFSMGNHILNIYDAISNNLLYISFSIIEMTFAKYNHLDSNFKFSWMLLPSILNTLRINYRHNKTQQNLYYKTFFEFFVYIPFMIYIVNKFKEDLELKMYFFINYGNICRDFLISRNY